MQSVFRRLSPARFIAIGFAATILIGSALLMLPVCVKPGVSLPYIDALYTSASAVCVTPSATSVTLSCLALPFVEKESIATFGSIPAIAFAEFAVAIAQSASPSEVYVGLSPQSANITSPSGQY